MTPEQLNWPQIWCKLKKNNVNPDHESFMSGEHTTSMWLRLPHSVSHSGDPTAIVQYIGEEFNYTFMPTGAMVECHNQDHVEDLLELNIDTV
tara:strand:+ start:81 stop:356 length:276 start_codon:yes stop_codon:yes gene_type:complete